MANEGSKEGFYSVTFAGHADYGFGIIILDTGVVIGADVGGVLYDGIYDFNHKTEMLDVSVTLTVPPGVPLVMGVPPQTIEYKFKIVTSLPRTLGNETPITIDTPSGPVNVIFKKIRDFPS